jgi:hypothetical protein
MTKMLGIGGGKQSPLTLVQVWEERLVPCAQRSFVVHQLWTLSPAPRFVNVIS